MSITRAPLLLVALAFSLPAIAADGGWVLVAHGGAGDYAKMPPDRLAARREVLAAAMRKGVAVLEGGGRSLDAVVATIRALEDSGEFDAGKGSYYSQDGVPELDASLMDGGSLAAGAVASVRRIANPIELARLVMERTPHVLLVGTGAEEFARGQGIELVSPYYFFTEREWERWRKARAKEADRVRERGTVGVVALDRAGHLAAGTSTGGTVMKMAGRVGDSPIIGAGTYANDRSCAVSATGAGEYFIRNVVAADICHRVLYQGVTLREAADEVVLKELVTQGGDGGVIAIDPHGNVATPFNTPGMLTGTARRGEPIRLQGWSREGRQMEVPGG